MELLTNEIMAEKIQERLSELQKELHEESREILSRPDKGKIEYEDVVTVFMLRKLAALQISLETTIAALIDDYEQQLKELS